MKRTHQYGPNCKINGYADGGQVRRSPPKPKPPPKPRSERSPDGSMRMKSDSAADALRNQRARQMKELGLKDGGPVRKLPPRSPMPAPQKGPKPKKIERRGAYRDGGKVRGKC